VQVKVRAAAGPSPAVRKKTPASTFLCGKALTRMVLAGVSGDLFLVGRALPGMPRESRLPPPFPSRSYSGIAPNAMDLCDVRLLQGQ
jgi:hypothetical protein